MRLAHEARDIGKSGKKEGAAASGPQYTYPEDGDEILVIVWFVELCRKYAIEGENLISAARRMLYYRAIQRRGNMARASEYLRVHESTISRESRKFGIRPAVWAWKKHNPQGCHSNIRYCRKKRRGGDGRAPELERR